MGDMPEGVDPGAFGPGDDIDGDDGGMFIGDGIP